MSDRRICRLLHLEKPLQIYARKSVAVRTPDEERNDCAPVLKTTFPMSTSDTSSPADKHNIDPVTGEPESHPVAAGAGSAGGGIVGAVIGGMVGGPVGAAAGAVLGGLAGGVSGVEAARSYDPEKERQFWSETHSSQPYAEGTNFEDYYPGYRTGYEGWEIYGKAGKSFDESEAGMMRLYEAETTKTTWMEARAAARAAWQKREGDVARMPSKRIPDGPFGENS